MTKDVTLSLRIDRALSNKLERRAKQDKRSKSSLAAMMIENAFEIEALTIAKIELALARAKAGGPFISDDDMARWMESLGTDHPLPKPKATIRF